MKNSDGTWFYSKNKITGKLGMVACLDTIFNTLFIFIRRCASTPTGTTPVFLLTTLFGSYKLYLISDTRA